MDLDINNYDLNDLLNLFQLDYNFTKDELKKAKKVVLKTHPDKSGLDKDYFLFFSKAYKLIYSVFEFREKNQNMCVKTPNYSSDDLHDSEKEALLKTFIERDDFNKVFNQMFEEQNLHGPSNSSGYGDWLNSDEDLNIDVANKSNMNQKIEEKKKELRSLVCVDKVDGLYGSAESNYSELLGDEPENYGSGVFSQLQYEDLRKAHKESVIPVTDEDIRQNFSSIDELTRYRNSELDKPDNFETSNKKLEEKKYNETISDVDRAFKLAKQDEEVKSKNNIWMTRFKQLL